jgi:cold shock CspA family protein
VSEETAAPIYDGLCKFWNPKGYGFLKYFDGRNWLQIYVHQTDVQCDPAAQYRQFLVENERVQLTVGQDRNGRPRAFKVIPLDRPATTSEPQWERVVVRSIQCYFVFAERRDGQQIICPKANFMRQSKFQRVRPGYILEGYIGEGAPVKKEMDTACAAFFEIEIVPAEPSEPQREFGALGNALGGTRIAEEKLGSKNYDHRRTVRETLYP